jgi:hypothetical protein
MSCKRSSTRMGVLGDIRPNPGPRDPNAPTIKPSEKKEKKPINWEVVNARDKALSDAADLRDKTEGKK